MGKAGYLPDISSRFSFWTEYAVNHLDGKDWKGAIGGLNNVNSALGEDYIVEVNSQKYYNHIFNANYNSDLNVNDFNDSDVSKVSDDEVENDELDFKDGFNNKLIECQDFEKIFQQKLISLYIKDVKEAKKFYYS